MSRHAGVLMHISSLPSEYGIGTFGKSAYKFVDFLKESGQKYWQILPLGPTGYGDSPYQSFSAFAGNPYFIDLDILVDQKLLLKEEVQSIIWTDNNRFVDYDKIYKNRLGVLKPAYERMIKSPSKEFADFKFNNHWWLFDYALFIAVKEHFNNLSFTKWPDKDIKFRKKKSIADYSRKLSKEIDFISYTQYLFFKQWDSLKCYANAQGIKIIGDMPIYVSLDSADVWSNPKLFWLCKNLNPVYVAGCPPDYFSKTGQLWGNPLYNWKYLKKTKYKWWIKRIEAATKLFDIIRIDHFRGFDGFYAVKYSDKTAERCLFKEGPGIKFFKRLNKSLGEVHIIAEDLGIDLKGAKKLLEQTGYPGMRVLQFAFDSDPNNIHLPHNHIKNSVVYTGTHDNDTSLGWFESAKKSTKDFAVKYLDLPEDESISWTFIKTAYRSASDVAIIPMQDILCMGGDCRMNVPSTKEGNWRWRLEEKYLTEKLCKQLHNLLYLYGRLERSDD